MQDTCTDDAIWIIEADGGTVELPATIAGIREVLDGERRAAFDRKVEQTPGNYLDRLLLHWALPDALLAEPGMAERVERGSLDGFARTPDGAPVLFTVVPEERPVPGVPPTWGVTTAAGRVRRPATIAGIRQVLDGERRERFDAEIPHTSGHRLFQRLVVWSTPPEIAAEIDAEGDRISSREAARHSGTSGMGPEEEGR